ncbi:NADH-quinone oxidoreductase subunit L [Actinomarinicola tropica]|uniref:NADH-quinone oxidoreductase subunit L n=1 Tax=Actinomarinicola tropica TaxID=2789776 RepID=A0A5Q2RH06_9ACTN|nr:NADH-quinone oxidoreductase subunit L [Actinomarinicola tropica]QGG93811.1 NADH-quinone oxidoreductase subunit L [Actinomarinicola tropica]
MLDLVWLIPALPLAGFLTLVVAGRRLGEPLAGWLATAAMGGSFLATVVVFVGLVDRPGADRFFTQTLFEWVPAGNLSVDAGFLVDPLSITMALFVTGVATLIHLYSIGYMHGDPNFSKFFLYLNLFAASMLVLVLGDNMLMTFLGWEGVGTCSYLLISFWFTSEENATAGKKAFVTNRIGDWGFMVAMFLAFATIGSLSYADLISASVTGSLAAVTATGIALLLFVGATGKSAQLPLFVWLPDAMAGPTPVSALIHAATMVTAGVYLFFRVSPVVAASYDWVPTVISWVGVLTALVAATIAISQNDIKKVLAYSTVSQLGFMFFAIGSGAYVAALFHVITHAFFKALLFLGSGSVIHGMHEEQDMRRMGGLYRYMPITAGTFIVGWLAIAGVPPFSGFWSKDEILLYAWADSKAIWAIGSLAALLTAFYMTRQVIMVFFGEPRWHEPLEPAAAAAPGGHEDAEVEPESEDAPAEDVAEHVERHLPDDFRPHESPWTMTLPLVVLATAALLGGGLNLPFTPDLHFLDRWLEPSLFGSAAHPDFSTGEKVFIAIFSIGLTLVGLALAFVVYVQRRVDHRAIEQDAFAQGWWIDSTYARLVDGPGRKLFEAAAWFDRTIIDGAVNGVATGVRAGGTALRTVQTGFVRTYALAIGLGAVLVAVWFLTRASF